MTTTIELLRKEARLEMEKRFWNGAPGVAFQVYEPYEGYEFLDWLITKVHNSAIRSALETLPPLNSVEDYEMTEAEHGWDNYRAETEKKLQSLLVNE